MKCSICLKDSKGWDCENVNCKKDYEERIIKESMGMNTTDVYKTLKRFNRWGNFLIPEYTWGDLRIDAIIINTDKKWIRGYEIKVSRGDFLNDDKWQKYSTFCSSLSVVCPFGLIQKNEICKPYGLLWVGKNGEYSWQRKPKNFQKREALAWVFQYYRVVESEFKRLCVV